MKWNYRFYSTSYNWHYDGWTLYDYRADAIRSSKFAKGYVITEIDQDYLIKTWHHQCNPSYRSFTLRDFKLYEHKTK